MKGLYKMKRSVIAILLILAVSSFAGGFDVKKYGAVGNGLADDTKAVQKAFDAAAKALRSFNSYGKYPRSSYFGSGPAVVFPHGVYKITSTIKVSGFVNFSGSNTAAVIKWAGEDNGVMFQVNAFRNTVEKLVFLGGGVQLGIANRNLDKTMVTIRDCQFHYASEMAVKLEPPKGISHLSCQTLIEACLFTKNHRCVQNYGDLMEIRNCWVDQVQPYMADGAAFINKYGTMRIAFCCLTPSANPPKGPDYYHNARWVDNYNRFEAENVRFGGEGGGIPAVYNFAKAGSRHPHSDGGRVMLRNCLAACGQVRRENGALVRLFAIPVQLTIQDCYGIGGIPLIVCDPTLDIQAEMKKNPRGLGNARFRIANNVLHSRGVNIVPEELKPFFRDGASDCSFAKTKARPVPEKITERTNK